MGSKNHNWKGGVSKLGKQIRGLLEYREWRQKVYERDDYTCQLCGKRGCKLEPHHKVSLSMIIKKNRIKDIYQALKCKELWDINNGLSLCAYCHSKTDNFRRRQLSVSNK